MAEQFAVTQIPGAEAWPVRKSILRVPWAGLAAHEFLPYLSPIMGSGPLWRAAARDVGLLLLPLRPRARPQLEIRPLAFSIVRVLVISLGEAGAAVCSRVPTVDPRRARKIRANPGLGPHSASYTDHG